MTAAELLVRCARVAMANFGDYAELLSTSGNDAHSRRIRQHGLRYKAQAIVYHDRVLTDFPRGELWMRKSIC